MKALLVALSPSIGMPFYTAAVANARFSYSVGTAGDVNGDGYADIIVGSYLYDNGQADEGCAYIYYGNASDGLEIHPQQRRADDSVPVTPGGQSISPTQACLADVARIPLGRSQVRLEWEVTAEGTAFSSSGVGQSACAAMRRRRIPTKTFGATACSPSTVTQRSSRTAAASYDLTLCLNYDDAELGSLTETDLELCRWTGQSRPACRAARPATRHLTWPALTM